MPDRIINEGAIVDIIPEPQASAVLANIRLGRFDQGEMRPMRTPRPVGEYALVDLPLNAVAKKLRNHRVRDRKIRPSRRHGKERNAPVVVSIRRDKPFIEFGHERIRRAVNRGEKTVRALVPVALVQGMQGREEDKERRSYNPLTGEEVKDE